MKRKIRVCVILVISMIVVHSHSEAEAGAEAEARPRELIERTCKKTPNYELCSTTLRGNPGSRTADVEGQGLIIVGAVRAKSREALSSIHKLSLMMMGQREALQRCAEVYKAVYEGEVPVAEQVIRGNPKFAESAMAGVAEEAETCQGAFALQVPQVLSGINKAVHDLAQVARAIIRNLL